MLCKNFLKYKITRAMLLYTWCFFYVVRSARRATMKGRYARMRPRLKFGTTSLTARGPVTPVLKISINRNPKNSHFKDNEIVVVKITAKL